MVQVVNLGSGLSREEAFRQGMGQAAKGLSGLGETISRKDAMERQRKKDATDFEAQLAKEGVKVSPEESQAIKKSFLSGDTSGISGLLQRRNENSLTRYGEAKSMTKQDRDLNRQYKQAQIGALQKKRDESTQGKQLSASDVRKVSEGSAIPTMLQDIRGTLEARKGDFGPIEGRLRGLNPYDTEAKATQSQMKAASQAFGRFMEGGVLRKEDEEKYREMFPQLSDTAEVASAKLDIIDRLLKQKQVTDIDALQQSGYDVSGLAQVGEVPAVPGQIRRPRGMVDQALDSAVPKAMASDPVKAQETVKQMNRDQLLKFIMGR